MTSRQTLKAKARQSAKDAPKADPATATRVLKDAKGQTGENSHRDKDTILSEFDDPAANTVR